MYQSLSFVTFNSLLILYAIYSSQEVWVNTNLWFKYMYTYGGDFPTTVGELPYCVHYADTRSVSRVKQRWVRLIKNIWNHFKFGGIGWAKLGEISTWICGRCNFWFCLFNLKKLGNHTKFWVVLCMNVLLLYFYLHEWLDNI